jgi:hypothetical protein
MEYEFDITRKSIPQGDCYLIPIKAVPSYALPVAAENGQFIITHSESGHHHVVMERPDIRQFCGKNIFRGFLDVVNGPTEILHLRDHHTHAPQTIAPGAWLIQRQAAHTPKG